jgi:hypothetical protein
MGYKKTMNSMLGGFTVIGSSCADHRGYSLETSQWPDDQVELV